MKRQPDVKKSEDLLTSLNAKITNFRPEDADEKTLRNFTLNAVQNLGELGIAQVQIVEMVGDVLETGDVEIVGQFAVDLVKWAKDTAVNTYVFANPQLAQLALTNPRVKAMRDKAKDALFERPLDPLLLALMAKSAVRGAQKVKSKIVTETKPTAKTTTTATVETTIRGGEVKVVKETTTGIFYEYLEGKNKGQTFFTEKGLTANNKLKVNGKKLNEALEPGKATPEGKAVKPVPPVEQRGDTAKEGKIPVEIVPAVEQTLKPIKETPERTAAVKEVTKKIKDETPPGTETPIPAKGKHGEEFAGAINLTKYPKESQPIITEIIGQIGKEGVEGARGRMKTSEIRHQATDPKVIADVTDRAIKGDIKPNTTLSTVETDALRIANQLTTEALIRDPSKFNKYKTQLTKLSLAQTSAVSEKGRSLRQLQEAIPSGITLQDLRIARRNAIKNGMPQEYINLIMGEIENVKKGKPTWKSKFVELRRNNLLSAGSSLVRAALGNATNLAWTTAEIPMSAAFNRFYTHLASGFGKVTGRQIKDVQTRFAYEVVGMAQGFGRGTKSGLKTAWQLMLENPEAVKNSSFFKREIISEGGELGGAWGKLVRTPQRAQGAIDVIFREPATVGFIHRYAYRKAYQEGLRGEAWGRRVAQILEKPSDAMIKEARTSAEFITFQAELGAAGKWINNIRKKSALAQSIVPFFNTHANILKAGIGRTPLGIVSKTSIDAFKKGARTGDWGAFSDRSAMATSGTLTMIGLYKLIELGLYDNIQGSWDNKSKSERELLEAQGKQSNSFEVYNDDGTLKWSVNFDGYEPSATVARMVGAINDGAKLNESDLEILSRAALALYRDTKESPFAQGIKEVVDLAEGRIDAMTFATRFIKSSFVPNFIFQTRGIFDPEKTETPRRPESFRKGIFNLEEWKKRFAREFPITTKGVRKKADILGFPIKEVFPEGRSLAVKVGTSPKEKDRALILAEFEKLNLGGLSWPKSIGKVNLTEEQEAMLEVSSGQFFFDILKDVMLSEQQKVKDSTGQEHALINNQGTLVTKKLNTLSPRWESFSNNEKIAIIKAIKTKVSEYQRWTMFPEEAKFNSQYNLNLYGEPQPTPKEVKKIATEEFQNSKK